VLDYILERKSVGDLLASIKSSDRYAAQKYHLRRCGLRHVYYLIEGDPEAAPSAVDQKIVRSAAASTEVADGFRVLRTGGEGGWGVQGCGFDGGGGGAGAAAL
jgi:crossover junction endonuclease MUS81